MKNDGEICLAAVKESGWALEYVGEEMKKDREICLAAVQQIGYALEYVGEELTKDREICLSAVKKSGVALEYVCEELKKDREICLAAVRKNGEALKYVGEELTKDREICLAAVQQFFTTYDLSFYGLMFVKKQIQKKVLPQTFVHNASKFSLRWDEGMKEHVQNAGQEIFQQGYRIRPISMYPCSFI